MQRDLAAGDLFSVTLLWEEGWMIHRFLEHNKLYPASMPILALTMIPFLALSEHDGIEYVNKAFDAKIPRDSERVHKVRNQMKSLGAKGIRFDEYSKETNELLSAMSRSFKGHRGLFSRLANALQPDMGIYYYRGMPIATTYTMARYLFDSESASHMLDDHSGVVGSLGYELGESGAFFYAFAEQLFPDEGVTSFSEFVTASNDVHLANLTKPLFGQGVDDSAVFFFLTDLMLQINAVLALFDAGMFTRRLFMKYMLATLFHGWKSVGAFTGYVLGDKYPVAFKRETVIRIGQVFPRSMSKKIEKAEPLRHAFVHYDYSAFSDTTFDGGEFPDDVLIRAIERQMGMELEEFEVFLFESGAAVSASIANITAFPEYNPLLNPDR